MRDKAGGHQRIVMCCKHMSGLLLETPSVVLGGKGGGNHIMDTDAVTNRNDNIMESFARVGRARS